MILKTYYTSIYVIAITFMTSLFVREIEGNMHTHRNRSVGHSPVIRRKAVEKHKGHLHGQARQNSEEDDEDSSITLSPSPDVLTPTPSFPQTTLTATSTSSNGPVTANPATLPTPMTTKFNTNPVPLYVPPFDPLADPGSYDVKYFGPGNGRSTVYEVVYAANANRGPITATMVADASDAKLFGAQQTTNIDGQSTQVWAAVSCGFADGLNPTVASPAAGYCVYYNNHDHATSTWTTAITQIQAETTITPSPGAVDSSIASFMSVHGDYAMRPSVSNNAGRILPSWNQNIVLLLSIIFFSFLML